MQRKGHILFLLFVVIALGCDDKPRKTPASAAAVKVPPSGVKHKTPGAVEQKKKVEQKIELSDSDFVDSLNTRDPFRSYLGQFAAPTKRAAKIQRKVLLQRYALDELALIAVVTGGARARAMFRDPTGLGVAVKRGDYISKSGGRVKQILTDKVVIQLEEQTEDRQTVADRVIELHPKKAQEEVEEEEE